jgi:hypothetical protein
MSGWDACHGGVVVRQAHHDTTMTTDGLLAACRLLNVTEGTILTDDQEGEEEAEGIKIRIRPVWRWLI